MLQLKMSPTTCVETRWNLSEKIKSMPRIPNHSLAPTLKVLQSRWQELRDAMIGRWDRDPSLQSRQIRQTQQWFAQAQQLSQDLTEPYVQPLLLKDLHMTRAQLRTKSALTTKYQQQLQMAAYLLSQLNEAMQTMVSRMNIPSIRTFDTIKIKTPLKFQPQVFPVSLLRGMDEHQMNDLTRYKKMSDMFLNHPSLHSGDRSHFRSLETEGAIVLSRPCKDYTLTFVCVANPARHRLPIITRQHMYTSPLFKQILLECERVLKQRPSKATAEYAYQFDAIDYAYVALKNLISPTGRSHVSSSEYEDVVSFLLIRPNFPLKPHQQIMSCIFARVHTDKIATHTGSPVSLDVLKYEYVGNIESQLSPSHTKLVKVAKEDSRGPLSVSGACTWNMSLTMGLLQKDPFNYACMALENAGGYGGCKCYSTAASSQGLITLTSIPDRRAKKTHSYTEFLTKLVQGDLALAQSWYRRIFPGHCIPQKLRLTRRAPSQAFHETQLARLGQETTPTQRTAQRGDDFYYQYMLFIHPQNLMSMVEYARKVFALS